MGQCLVRIDSMFVTSWAGFWADVRAAAIAKCSPADWDAGRVNAGVASAPNATATATGEAETTAADEPEGEGEGEGESESAGAGEGEGEGEVIAPANGDTDAKADVSFVTS
jgi:hypothetical protein